MPTQWDEFEAVEESPAVDWNEFEEEPLFSNLAGQRINLPRSLQNIRESRIGPITFGKEEYEYELKPGSALKNVVDFPVMPEIYTPGISYVPGMIKVPATPFQPAPSLKLPSVEEDLMKPLINLVPENPAFAPAVVRATSDPSISPEVRAKRIAQLEGVADSMRDTVNFFTSPFGISTLGLGGMPKAVQSAIAASFAVHMGSQVPEIAKELGNELGKPEAERDQKKIANLVTTAATTTGFSALAGAHATKPVVEAVREPSQFFRPKQGDIVTAPIETMVEAPKPGEVSPGATLATQPTPGMREIKTSDQGNPVDVFNEEVSSPTGKLSNDITKKAGMAITNVSDFDRLVELRNQYEREFNTEKERLAKLSSGQKSIAEITNLTRLASKVQFAREVIETATNTGGWVEGGLTKLGERPLDWSKNPEAAEWLRKNGEKIGIDIPDELKSKEILKPAAEKTVPVYHGEGGTEGAGLGGFSVSESQKYAASFGPRQSVVEVPESVLEKMKEDARNRGEPSNLVLPEEYQKQLRPVEKPIEPPTTETSFITKESVEAGKGKLTPDEIDELGRLLTAEEFAMLDTAQSKRLAELRKKTETSQTPEPVPTPETTPVGVPPAIPEPTGTKPAPVEPKPVTPVQEAPIDSTSLKNAVADLERVSYGFKERSLPEKQVMAEAWVRAGNTIAKDPEAGRKLAQALIENPERSLTGDESALLLRHKMALENALNSAAERTLTGTPEIKVEANAELTRYRAELDALLDAISARGTQWGREGRWRQALAYENFSFAAQERLLSAAKGRALTDTERVELQTKLSEYKAKLDALEKFNAERDQKTIDAAVNEALEKISRQGGEGQYSPRIIQVAEKFATYMDGKADAAKTRLASKFSRTSAGIDPTILSDVVIIGTAKLARGFVDFAKWSEAMIKDLGPAVQDYLKAAWDQTGKTLDKELSKLEKTIGKTDASKVKQVVIQPTPADQASNLASKIAGKIQSNNLNSVTPLVRKLARHFVSAGIRGRENLIDSVHGELQKVMPEITRSETMRMISGYGDYRLLPKDEVSVLLRGYKGEMQQIAKLEDIAKGEAPKKTGQERRTPTEEERQKIKEVEEAKKKGGYTVTDPETQLRTPMDAVKTRLRNQITDLEKQISTREKIIKDPTRFEYDAEANKLKARRDELKNQFDEIFPKEPITEFERLQRWKDRTQKKITELQDMMKSGDIEVKPKRLPVELDAQGRSLQADLDQTKEELRHAREKAEWEKMSVFQKSKKGAVDTYDMARMLMTTGEFSFVLRQGKWIALSHPTITARALPDMFRAMKNWKTAHEIDLKILNDPDYTAAKKAKLHIVDEGASLSRQEEIYAGRWAHAIPVISHFNRAARVFLNKIRFDTWKAIRKANSKGGVPDPVVDAQAAMFVNESTGRGSLGFAEPAAVALGRALFAPRYMVSRFQLLTGHSMWQGNARSRAMIAKEYARALIGLGIYYTMLNAMFSGSKDKKPTTFDPRSTDFGKVRVGDTRIDPLSGLAQAATLIGRTVTGETKTQKGRVVPIRRVAGQKPHYGDPTWTDVASRFARSKMHPIPGAIVNLFEGTTMDGSETSIAKETGNLMGPITYIDIYKALSEQDIPDATAMSLLAILGEGLQTYKPKK